MPIQIKEYSIHSPAYVQEKKLRYKVLREPLGLDFSEEDLATDHLQIHIGAFLGEDLVGCLLLAPQDDKTVKMRQVAVTPALQNQGIGQRMVHFAETLSKQKKFSVITLNARMTAIPFYERLGYEIYGEPLTEVRIPHRKMRKTIV